MNPVRLGGEVLLVRIRGIRLPRIRPGLLILQSLNAGAGLVGTRVIRVIREEFLVGRDGRPCVRLLPVRFR